MTAHNKEIGLKNK